MTDRRADTLSCAEARDLYHSRLDGLTEQTGLEAHLSGCGDCRRYVAQMQALDAVLGDLRRESAAVTLPRGTRRSGRGRWAPYRILTRVAAAVVLVAGAGWYLMGVRQAGDGGLVHRAADRSVPATSPVAQPAEPPTIRPASLELTDGSADTYIAVRRDSGRPTVHLFVLYPVAQEASARERL